MSFKLGLDFDLLDAVMVESFWPRGIQIKPFRFQRFHKRAPTYHRARKGGSYCNRRNTLNRFVLAHQNVRSMRRSVDKIEKLISDLGVDIMCITEHWLSTEEIESTGIVNFKLAAKFCRAMGQYVVPDRT